MGIGGEAIPSPEAVEIDSDQDLCGLCLNLKGEEAIPWLVVFQRQ
jgi:hypothetical protein